MDVVKEIIQNSAIGPLSYGYKSAVLILFGLIVSILLVMLALLLSHGADLTFHYGY